MSDFAQTGLISTFQQLNHAHLPELEAQLRELAKLRPIALVLPCHGQDLERPALAHIVAELRQARFISEILVSLNGIDASGLQRARQIFGTLPHRVRFLWTDGPEAKELLNGYPSGKGRNVWSAFGILGHDTDAAIFALQDCDVASFSRYTLARLCYACAHPQLDYAFAKMYYSRATDRLYGRVSRLFFAPLLHAIVRLAGHHPLIDFLQSFRYPLAGECAITRAAATRLPLSSGWGLETGMLCDIFRLEDPRHICQVDGGSGYDHKHQPALGALADMCAQIARTLLGHLAQEGLLLDPPFRHALAEGFQREAALALQRSAKLALINGFPFDNQAEQAIVNAFGAQLQGAGPEPEKMLPAWSTLSRSQPGFARNLARLASEVV